MNKLSLYTHEICDPDPKALPDEHERKLQYRRNQNFIAMITIMLSFLIINAVFVPMSTSIADYWFIFLFSCVLIVFCLTCRSHFTFFKIFYLSCISTGGPIALYLDQEGGIFACWASAHLAPLLLLYYTRCRKLYISQVGIQLLLLNFLYKDKMISTIDFAKTDEFMLNVTYSTEFTMLVCAFIVAHVNASLESTYRQEIALNEKKRKELEVQKTFILSFSHEIRNLINNLTGNIQLSLLEKIPPKVKGYLEDAEIGAGMLIQLINNILDTGNLEVGELEVSSSNQLIHSTLEKTWRMCAYLLKAKNLRGQLRILRNLPKHLMIDHSRLLQILINLVMNAVKFTDKGSIDVKLEWMLGSDTVTEDSFFPSPFDDVDEGIFEKDQAISLLLDDFTVIGLDKKRWSCDRYHATQGSGVGLLKISITDTGCGVHPDNIPKVFDKFSDRIFGDASSNRLGTTIGLYITKVLCNKMGGDIRVFSKPNKGTSFIACIPAEQIETKVVRQEMSIATLSTLPELRKLKAMIVDDLNFNIVVLSSYLQRMRIEVTTTAVDGSDAYSKYVKSVHEGNRPDVVTMDVEMPVMDGKTAAQLIRKYEKENNLEPCYLIMISGNVGESEINQCLWYNGETLANCFIKKPAIFDDVFRVINDRFYISSQSDISNF